MSSSREMGRKQSFAVREQCAGRSIRRGRCGLALLLGVLLLPGAVQAADLLHAVPAASRQLVLVTTDAWTASAARVECFTRRAADAPWRREGAPLPALTGARGLAWGRGLHTIPPGATRRKREGDRCAPAGVFRITGAFGQLAPRALGPLRIGYRQVSEGWEAVDDPASRHYNRIVYRPALARPDWRSSERLWTGSHYRLAVDLAHNPQGVPGAGSCIFLHVWSGVRAGTAGCTVLRLADLRGLVRWLDAAAQPVLLQAPAGVAPRLP